MKIRTIRKSKQLYLINITDTIWGVLPIRILQFFMLPLEGEREISDEQAEPLKVEIRNYAWQKLLGFLAYRERSISEVQRYLKNLPVHPEIAADLIKKSRKENFIDDERMAQMLIEDYLELGKSRIEIKTKMMSKGISADLCEEYLNRTWSDQVEQQILRKILQKTQAKFNSIPPLKKREKILNYLVRRGFRFSICQDVLRNSDLEKEVNE